MGDTIKTFLKDGKLKTSAITIKLIKKVSESSYIIADRSMASVLNTDDSQSQSRNLAVGCCYKLIKCEKVSSTMIKLNQNLGQ